MLGRAKDRKDDLLRCIGQIPTAEDDVSAADVWFDLIKDILKA